LPRRAWSGHLCVHTACPHCLPLPRNAAQVAIFNGLQEQVIAKLCFAMKPYKAMKNDWIYREGEVCREFFIIEEGVVELSRFNVLLASLEKGSAFGEDALYGGRMRERSALAAMDCELACITMDKIVELSENFPDLGRRLEEISNKRLQREKGRLQSILDVTAQSLGISTESEVMGLIVAKTEALIEEEQVRSAPFPWLVFGYYGHSRSSHLDGRTLCARVRHVEG
jgi:CRP-like cAMP-binding protein